MKPLEHAAPALFVEALEGSEDSTSDAAELAGALGLAFVLPPPESLRTRLLDSVSLSDQRFAPFWDQLSALFDLSVEAMRTVLLDMTRPDRWEATPIPGVEALHFSGGASVASADCGLVRFAPGTPFPQHEHLGPEHVIILEGSYVDDLGERFGPGDLHVMLEGSSHALFACAKDGCLLATRLHAGINIPGVGQVGG